MAERPTPDSTASCSKRRSPRGARGTGRSGRTSGSGVVVAPVGSKSGSHTSSHCSKRTRTSSPTATSESSAPTMLVVSRTEGSSANATTAIT